MSIIKLKPSCKNYLWGGNKLRTEFHKQSSEENIAETWELSCHPDGQSLIAEGKFAGKTLQEYIDWEGKKVLGKNCERFEKFPILIKFIDAKENLSIQVHPSDAYALKNEGQYGKTEMWYVVDCEEDASLYYGASRKVDDEEFEQRLKENTVLEVLNKVPVKKGDVFFIEAGVVHAIGKGIVIAEIQQNSNLTYRVYDYGRVGKDGQPRELHVEKALKVMNRKPMAAGKSFEPHLGSCEYFTVDKVSLDGKLMNKVTGTVGEDTFLHMLVVEGSGKIRTTEEASFEKGDSILITAGSGKFELNGNCQVLLSTVPSAEM